MKLTDFFTGEPNTPVEVLSFLKENVAKRQEIQIYDYPPRKGILFVAWPVISKPVHEPWPPKPEEYFVDAKAVFLGYGDVKRIFDDAEPEVASKIQECLEVRAMAYADLVKALVATVK